MAEKKLINYYDPNQLTLRGRRQEVATGPALKLGENLSPRPTPKTAPDQPGQGANPMGNVMKLAQVFAAVKGGTPGGGGADMMTQSTPAGTYQTPSNSAVNMPEASGAPQASGTPLMDYWKQPVIGKMPLDQFVSMAGMLAGAIAPNTPQGRVGSAMSSLATSIYGKRMDMEAGAPEAEQQRRLTEAKIGHYERLAQAEEDPSYVKDIRQDPETGKWFQGWGQKGTDEFIPTRSAAPGELQKILGKDTKTDKPGWFTANVDGKPKRMKQTPENTAKYEVWQKPSARGAGKRTETEKQIDIRMFNNLRGITHDDKTGKPRGTVSAQAIEALNKTATEYGKEVVKFELPELDKGLWGDIPSRNLYMVVDQDQEGIDPQDVMNTLITDYNIDPKDAKKILEKMTGEEPYRGD